jgi:hypothetical protein
MGWGGGVGGQKNIGGGGGGGMEKKNLNLRTKYVSKAIQQDV